ncbi:hypothetical protein KFL_006630050 [Klebsormidium nitens]|uniref:Stc1 domain-containing protein n=1 Tax=Klebsormidium nitens TaxID=105231 RepID=A0A1Y1IR52_KLENI|nr:hypothetical protein KFL_006630050 [Klebsormidium nitens]|eukprot:GAQ90618.1 hypothetical protein KFL_006630050 [Klebsormidium nitens]
MCRKDLNKSVTLRRQAFAGHGVAPRAKKLCRSCDKVKKLGEFYVDVTSADGLGYACKTCSSAQARARYRAKKRKAAGPLKEAEASPPLEELDVGPCEEQELKVRWELRVAECQRWWGVQLNKDKWIRDQERMRSLELRLAQLQAQQSTWQAEKLALSGTSRN